MKHIFNEGFAAVASDDMTDWARDELAAAEERLKSAKAKKNNVISAIEETRSSGDLIARLLELETEIDEAQKQVDEKREWISALIATYEHDEIVADYDMAMQKIKDIEEIDYRASLHERILRVLNEIYIYGDRLLIVLRWRTSQNITKIQLNGDGGFVVVDDIDVKIPDARSQ